MNMPCRFRRFWILGAISLFVVAHAAGQTIPQTNWSLKYVDSQETQCENAPATAAFDGNASTFWHTAWCNQINNSPPPPHEIQINLGAIYNVSGFTYLPRQDSTHGWIGQYEFYVSSDGTNWGTPVASGTFAADASLKTVTFATKTGSYIRLVALTEAFGRAWTSAAEINALGTVSNVNQPPSGNITSPSSDVTITKGGTVNFAASASDPNGDSLTYHWTFGTGSGVADSLVQNPGAVQFNNTGTYTVTFNATDPGGLSIATPPTRTITVLPPGANSIIPHTHWSLKYVDSQETQCESDPATAAFDDNNTTFWHTLWCNQINNSPPPPHEIQIDMGAIYDVSGFTYLPRQDSTHGWIGQYQFYVSSDGTNWGTPVASGTFPADTSLKTVSFPTKTGRYIRLVALTEAFGRAWTSAVEINALGSLSNINQPPTGSITSPSSDVTIAPGGTVNFAASASDPNGDPLSYRWTFGSGSGVPDYLVLNPGAVQFNVPGTYTVTFNATDPGGLSIPTPPTRTVNVVAPGSSTVIPQTNWSLKYVDSQETQCDSEPATAAFDGNTSTFWHTAWCNQINNSPPPPHEIQINLGATYNINGFTYLPRQDSTHGWIGQYQFYVSSDGTNWGTPVASGTFPADTSLKTVSFPTKTGRYIRLVALTEAFGRAWTSAVEINVLADLSGALPPDGQILTPSSNATISVGDVINFSGSATSSNGDPVSYLWNFGNGSGIPNSTSQNPGYVQFNSPGTYTVTLTATDTVTGLSDATPASRTINVVQSGFALSSLSHSGWTLKYVDSQETVCENDAATRAFDGQSATFWHTQWCNGNNAPLPHEIQIDLGATYNIGAFQYLPRQDSTHGWIAQYEFYVSTDGNNWGRPVASGTFANDITLKQVSFPDSTARYIRLRALSEVAGRDWTSAAEINVLQTLCGTPPGVRITSPHALYLQTSSTLQVTAQACLDSNTEPNWGVRFVLDGGAQKIDDHTAPFQATFSNVSKAEHTIDAYVIDSSGNVVSGTGTSDHASQIGIGDYYVTMGDSITAGYGDDVAADNTSSDGRNSGGGYEPVLNNLLTAAKGYPQNVVNEGVGGTTSGDGLALVSSLLARHPNAQMFLVDYGMNDARPWLPVPSGLGLNPGDSGYAGSFKDNMQQIINAVNAAGKKIALSKINPALADCAVNNPSDPGYCAPYPNFSTGARTVLIQKYNQVVDELRAIPSNKITVVPPDLYTYFANHTQTEYFDNIHPNGVGYQAVGNLWLQALP